MSASPSLTTCTGSTASWRIYDLAIDGAGTAAGNRRQYARYIERHSFEKLLQRLKSQLESLSGD